MRRIAHSIIAALSLACSLIHSASAQNKTKSDTPPAQLGYADDRKAGRLPDLTAGLSTMAAQAFGKKEWDKARNAYREMLKAEPDNPLTLSNLGAVEQQSGHLNEAKNYLLRAVQINPALQQTWIALGLVCHEMGDSYLAVSALSRAVHEDPSDSKAHNYLAVVARSLGWLDAAEAELQRAIELNPKYSNAHFNLALMYLDRNPPSIALAKKHYDQALALGAEKDDAVEEKLKQK